MSDPTHPETTDPERVRPQDDGRAAEERPPEAASGDDEAREEGKGGMDRVPSKDAPRIVPERGGQDDTDMREHDLATHPDKIDDNPDGAGDRPRPL